MKSCFNNHRIFKYEETLTTYKNIFTFPTNSSLNNFKLDKINRITFNYLEKRFFHFLTKISSLPTILFPLLSLRNEAFKYSKYPVLSSLKIKKRVEHVSPRNNNRNETKIPGFVRNQELWDLFRPDIWLDAEISLFKFQTSQRRMIKTMLRDSF